MKYIKTYEETNYRIKNYNVGDYVWLSSIYFTDKKEKAVKITDADDEGYSTLFSNGKYIWVNELMINRKLNDEEIEEFKAEEEATNYNIL